MQKKITIIKGKQQPMPDYIIDHETTKKEFDQDQHFKYLGVSEAAVITHKIMKTKLTKEYIYRMRKILKTNLTSNNKITVINQL